MYWSCYLILPTFKSWLECKIWCQVSEFGTFLNSSLRQIFSSGREVYSRATRIFMKGTIIRYFSTPAAQSRIYSLSSKQQPAKLLSILVRIRRRCYVFHFHQLFAVALPVFCSCSSAYGEVQYTVRSVYIRVCVNHRFNFTSMLISAVIIDFTVITT